MGMSAAAAALPMLGAQSKTAKAPIWADLIHLGHNMWVADRPYDTKLRCEDAEWRAITDRMAAVGMNMIVIDLAEGIVYPSHPETAIAGSWSVKKIRAEIAAKKVLQMHELDQVECYLKLDKAGFDQIPCGGNWREDVNFGETVKFCRANLAPERLLGFLVAPWRSHRRPLRFPSRALAPRLPSRTGRR